MSHRAAVRLRVYFGGVRFKSVMGGPFALLLLGAQVVKDAALFFFLLEFFEFVVGELGDGLGHVEAVVEGELAALFGGDLEGPEELRGTALVDAAVDDGEHDVVNADLNGGGVLGERDLNDPSLGARTMVG
ncbi:MAG TPA: hypothetical protein VD837_08760 [Terriglobales bacterium]|nr:hypothetical protein [Terriglobales bacterium]